MSLIACAAIYSKFTTFHRSQGKLFCLPMDPRLFDLQDQKSGEHHGADSTDFPPPLSNDHWDDFDEFIVDELPQGGFAFDCHA